MWNITSFLIILSSIIIIPSARIGDIWWIPKEAVFNLGGIILISYSFITDNPRIRLLKNRWLGLILAYTSFLWIWVFYKPLIFNNAEGKVLWNLWTMRPMLNLIIGFWILKILVEYTDNLARWVKIANLLCYLAFFFACFAILQYFELSQILTGNVKWLLVGPAHVTTFLGNEFLTANFLAILSPLCLIFRGIRYKIFYSTIILAILLTQSAISLLAIVASFLGYLILTKKRKFALFLFVLLAGIGAYLYFNHQAFFSFSGRLGIWKDVFYKCKETFITGKGIGSFAVGGIMSSGRMVKSAHCEFLQILYEGGLIMLALVCAYLIDLFKRIILTKDTILKTGYVLGLISFLIIFSAGFPLRIAPLALIGIVYISALEAQL